ncbi:MAG TPA: undecaprenyl-diphosphate phosphatase [Candidatus Acidoferrum sp.]|nr:undecaprenyl-diphosphate phosphatase [Candidatus Acidoferrum sp.]
MPEWLIVIVLGLVEGITEFIPVSSTGHLLLAEHVFKWKNDLFTIVVQSAAVLAVIPLFWPRIKRLSQVRVPESRDYLAKVTVAFAITAAGGFALDKNGFTLPDHPLPISIALLVGGILFVLIEGWLRGTVTQDEIAWPMVFAVAAGQLIAAVFPGASRSGTTILLALLLGLSRPAATEFSFIVGIPTMLAAGGYKILKALLHQEATPDWSLILLGSVVSAAVSFAAVKWLLRFVQSHTFIPFGWYRIAFGLLLLLFLK